MNLLQTIDPYLFLYTALGMCVVFIAAIVMAISRQYYRSSERVLKARLEVTEKALSLVSDTSQLQKFDMENIVGSKLGGSSYLSDSINGILVSSSIVLFVLIVVCAVAHSRSYTQTEVVHSLTEEIHTLTKHAEVQEQELSAYKKTIEVLKK